VSLVPPKPSPLVPGYRLDRYELLCPIARGGMAEVWVARLRGKHGFEKLVAIKTILPEFAQEPAFQRMFLDEAHIASGIQHQSVAQILDLGEQHDVLYLVMEWVDGDALSKLQRAVDKKQTKIPVGVVLRILADACGGLHAAHELTDKEGHNLGVVHRDVSPQNVLVSNKGVAKLIDFGIAKARDRVAGDTASGMLKGKIQYMAPEQALGKAIDRRADVWAIGAMLHHMLAGRPPFEAENQLATLHLLASGRPPPALPKEVPEAVADVVRRTLKHDPEKRIATAADLQKAIENAMAEAWVTTSTGEVAAYVAEHLAERADNRRKAVELALKAAAEREKMIELLKPPSVESSSGVANFPHKIDFLAKSPRAPTGLVSSGDDTHVDLPVEFVDPLPTVPPPAETSAATTLGSSLLEPPRELRPGAERRKKIAVGVIAAAGGLLVIASIFVLARGRAPDDAKGGVERPAAARPTAAKAEDEPTPSAVAATAPLPSSSTSAKQDEPAPKPTTAIAVKVASPPPTATPTATPTAKPTASASAPKKKKTIDDGF
jgi:serine/threonine protein kinase